MKKFAIALAAILVLPAIGQADVFTLDYNEASYTTTVAGTFDIGTDVGAIESADLTLCVAGRRTYYNSRGYGWYYDNSVTLSAAVQNAWSAHSLPGSFDLYTFHLDESAVTALQTTGLFNFTLTGNDAYWYSDLSSWGGYSTSRVYADYATLDVVTVPLPATLPLIAGPALALITRRRRAA